MVDVAERTGEELGPLRAFQVCTSASGRSRLMCAFMPASAN
jgi:hypothetical protein